MPEERSITLERLAEMRETLSRVVAPVKEEVAELDARLERLDEERRELLEVRRELMAVVRVADPTEREKKATKSKATKAQSNGHIREVADKVEEHLKRHGEDGEITATSLARVIPDSSPQSVRQALELLTDSGVVRVDRKTRGGGLAYKLVGVT